MLSFMDPLSVAAPLLEAIDRSARTATKLDKLSGFKWITGHDATLLHSLQVLHVHIGMLLEQLSQRLQRSPESMPDFILDTLIQVLSLYATASFPTSETMRALERQSLRPSPMFPARAQARQAMKTDQLIMRTAESSLNAIMTDAQMPLLAQTV